MAPALRSRGPHLPAPLLTAGHHRVPGGDSACPTTPASGPEEESPRAHDLRPHHRRHPAPAGVALCTPPLPCSYLQMHVVWGLTVGHPAWEWMGGLLRVLDPGPQTDPRNHLPHWVPSCILRSPRFPRTAQRFPGTRRGQVAGGRLSGAEPAPTAPSLPAPPRPPAAFNQNGLPLICPIA